MYSISLNRSKEEDDIASDLAQPEKRTTIPLLSRVRRSNLESIPEDRRGWLKVEGSSGKEVCVARTKDQIRFVVALEAIVPSIFGG